MVRGLIVALTFCTFVAGAAASSRQQAFCGDPVWAPNGHALAFTRITESGDRAIFRIGLDGKGERRLSGESGYAYEPVWSPDGRAIAYGTFDRAAIVHIVVARANGGSPRGLATFGWEREPPTIFLSWSPDGKELAYVGGDGGLYAVNIDGPSGERLVARGANEPAWSPADRRIAYVVDVGIVVADASGADAKVITTGGAFPAWSPNGKQIAYEERSGTHVHVMNADGTNDRVVDRDGSLIRLVRADGRGERTLTSCRR